MAKYRKGYPIAGDIRTKKLKVEAGKYHLGMPIGWNTTGTGANTVQKYNYDKDAPEVIAWETKTLATDGELLVAVTGSEILLSGIKSNRGAALTLTDAAVRTAMQNGIILR